MAVIQISKIQVRRGLQENLPQLAGGEFGWSVDERRLWIGNGTLAEGAPEQGNTEILTNRSDVLEAIESYTFKGEASGYVSRTGPNILAPVTRTLQEKFDDIVNFRDFITDADAASGNYTTALQRAIDQVFPNGYDDDENAGVRRILKIPGGRWQISNVTIPPYASLQGDGKFSTIIWGNIAVNNIRNTVFEVRDSQGNVGTQVNALTSHPPGNVSISGMSIVSATGGNVVTLESATGMYFNDVAFIGANIAPVDLPGAGGNLTVGVAIGSTVFPSKHIAFEKCSFRNLHAGLGVLGDVTHVTVNDSEFFNLMHGVVARYVAAFAQPPEIKIVGSYFSNIANSAIYSTEESSVVSSFNRFTVCGNGDGTVMDSGSPVHPIFRYDGAANYSISDIFDRTLNEELTSPIYQIEVPGVSTYKAYSASGTLRTTPGYSADIPDGGVFTSEIQVLDNESSIIDYRIYRSDGANVQSRVGTVKVTHLNGTVNFDDEYTETANIAVALTWSTTANSVTLQFDSAATGQPSYVSYSSRSFF